MVKIIMVMFILALVVLAGQVRADTITAGGIVNGNNAISFIDIPRDINISGSVQLLPYEYFLELKLDVISLVERAKSLRDILRLI